MNKIKKSSNKTAKRGKIKFTIWGTLYNYELPLIKIKSIIHKYFAQRFVRYM